MSVNLGRRFLRISVSRTSKPKVDGANKHWINNLYVFTLNTDFFCKRVIKYWQSATTTLMKSKVRMSNEHLRQHKAACSLGISAALLFAETAISSFLEALEGSSRIISFECLQKSFKCAILAMQNSNARSVEECSCVSKLLHDTRFCPTSHRVPSSDASRCYKEWNQCFSL